MENYFKEGDADVPMFDFNIKSGKMIIRGRSFPEDTVEVYLPVLDWIDVYITIPADLTLVQFELDYFNSSTYKAILNILLKLEKLMGSDKKVRVEWFYHERDIDMKEVGEEFEGLVDIPFSFRIKQVNA